MDPLTAEERRRLKSQISCSLANLQECRLLWSPSRRKLIARSVRCSRRFVVPADAVLIGTFAHGITARDILDDLEELLARLESA